MYKKYIVYLNLQYYVKYVHLFIKKYWHKQSYVIKYNHERVIRMKFLKNNKGVILFYMVILVFSLIIVNDVKKDQFRENNKYVMVNLDK